MIAIIRACLLLFVLKVAANQNDAPSTTVLTETTTLYATLVPPVLPAVTVSTSRTQSVFTSTSILIVNLNCTAKAYSAIVAPPTVASVPSIAPSIPVATPAPVPSSKVARQVTSATLASSTVVVATSSENIVTATVATTITATMTLAQRPAVTRTVYSIIYATQATPFVRTFEQCSATQEVLYTIETATVTSTFSRTVWPSTVTTVTFVACTPRPVPSRVPPVGPSIAMGPPAVAVSTGAVQSKDKRQVIVSTTVHQTRVIYAATTIVETTPYTRVVTSCSVSTASTSAA